MSKVLLFKGDSITDAGRNKEEFAPANKGLGIGYAHLTAAELLASEPGKDWQIYNRGISGNRVVDLYARWKKDALVLRPDVLSILIGVNDTWHEYNNQNGVEVPRYDEFLRRLLSWSLETLPELKIVLLEPFVLPFGAVGEAWPAEIAERGEVVRKAAEDFGAVFAPLQDKFTEAAKKYGMEYWLRDGVHPTYAGHRLIAKEWMKAAGHLL
jgi:lysophospholipase L1-like esterase